MTVSPPDAGVATKSEWSGSGEDSDFESLAIPLAHQYQQTGNVKRDSLISEYLAEYRAIFLETVDRFRGAVDSELALTYAAEWVLDNDFLVITALRQIGENLPASYERQLPVLVDGAAKGQPRVYALARELVRLTKAQLDLDRLMRFLAMFQTVTPLTMGELWALPIFLRLGVLQALILAASRLTGIESRLEKLDLHSVAWEPEFSAEQIIANAFVSLRALAAEDWKDFFEALSPVEHILAGDPAQIYAFMDFETRDRYRKVVEALARATGQDEQHIARTAVHLAESHPELAGNDPNRSLPARADEPGADVADRKTHVGYYLLDDGARELEERVGYRPTAGVRIKRWALTNAVPLYLLTVWGITGLIMVFFANFVWKAGGAPWQVWLAAALGFFPASMISVHLVNWGVTQVIPPRVLPKMDFSTGIPAPYNTLVVVPALLTHTNEVASLISQLELHYLRNPDQRLYFALLSDPPDADQECLPEDEILVKQTVEGIEALNRKYPRPDGPPFLLLHRERRWNPREKGWIGWERKRGKLHELNQLILSARASAIKLPSDLRATRTQAGPQDHAPERPTGFPVQAGAVDILADIRYVITLDADTVLLPDAAWELAATLAHPLNQAVFSAGGEICAGYSILQPRTEISPASAFKSSFTRYFSGDAGLDLYTLAVSDVYQDLFGEGTYVGKGIYDVAAFERSLEGRAPENALLSHDLFEGSHGRAGLVTDVVMLEDYPSNYISHARRLHRWIRGDWQLIPWLMPLVPGEQDRRVPNRLSPISRWKFVDNLRRSLVPPGLLLTLAAGWLGFLPGGPFLWTLAGVAPLAMPLLTDLVMTLRQIGQKTGTAEVSWQAAHPLRFSFMRWLLAVAFLPFEALLSITAITVTLGRLLFTRRNMLRWTTAAQTEQLLGEGHERASAWLEMAAAPVTAAGLAILLAIFQPGALLFAAPFLILWFLSPEIAYRISLPLHTEVEPLSEDDRARLRLLARRTWLFFEQFVGPEDQWLPPDHFQESPLGTVAHRTSPTNIGLNLLTILGAYDLGYIDLLGMTARLHSSFDTLARLERDRGHFLNWYDTRTLEPLEPRYISTVDSGNLAGCLIALRQGLLDLPTSTVLRGETLEGLLDGLALLQEHIQTLDPGELRPSAGHPLAIIAALRERIQAVGAQPLEWGKMITELSSTDSFSETVWARLDESLLAFVEERAGKLDAEGIRRLRLYTASARLRLDHARRELEILHPWITARVNPPALFSEANNDPALSAAWQAFDEIFSQPARVGEIEAAASAGRAAIETLLAKLESIAEDVPADVSAEQVSQAVEWSQTLYSALEAAGRAAQELLIGVQALIDAAEIYLQDMDFSFLFDPERQVFHIGYNRTLGKLDNNYYDLLASEARIASLVAIAKDEVPASHWLHLARPLTRVDGRQALLSWSATLFEYLMPALLLRNYRDTLLDQSAFSATDIQINYGRSKGTPWGISESGYYNFDPGMAYQYRAFGVPGLGFKRGLGDDLVIAPYASLLALSLRPQSVLQNLTDLEKLGAQGAFGLYEAVDFTPERMNLGQKFELVREYMAHHQGMIFLSLVNAFLDDRMVERFHRDARIRSVELLLQEQIPTDVPLDLPHTQEGRAIRPEQPQVIMTPWRARVNAPQPRVHYLSNGNFSTLITASGGGFSAWQDTALTRWRADTTLNGWGTWIYIQDMDSHRLWSASFEPTAQPSNSRDVYFNAHTATFSRQDDEVTTEMEIVIAPDDDIEIRRLTVSNRGNQIIRLRLTSYAEVVLGPPAGDQRHPAFSKLFVESEFLAEENALLFRRRPRSHDEASVFMAHALIIEDQIAPTGAFESDRARFLGRGGTARKPQALQAGSWLSQTAGATLDPIMALGQEITLEPHTSVRLAWITAAAAQRPTTIDLIRRYTNWAAVEHAFMTARATAEVELRQLGLHTTQLPRIQHLLSAMLYPHIALRSPVETLRLNSRGQSGLWPYAISGDYPMLLARIGGQDELALVQDLLQAHAYWRKRGLKIDLIILNEEGANYGQELNAQLYRLFARSGSDAWLNRRGGIFLLLADQLVSEDRTLIETAARVVLDGKFGSLAEQVTVRERLPARLPDLRPGLPEESETPPTQPVPRPQDLQFDNGLGGFSPDGREYCIYLEAGQCTPAPWINVIANPEFGCLVTEAGLGYTWAINSGENRLTPWSNDPVSDPASEALYLRDEETARVWTPTPLPAPAAAPYLIRHGAGYTQFEHASHGLEQRLRVFVAPDAPVKIISLRLENRWDRARRITVTYYADWVMGVQREDSQAFILPEFDSETQALLARNPYNVEFGERVGFAAASKKLHGLTADRTEFFGRLGDRALPNALRRIGLAGTVQPGLDPCAALQLHVDLQPGAEEEVFFLLGQGANREDALRLVQQYQQAEAVQAAFARAQQTWDDILGTVTVRTPDPAMDLLLNRWLLYQGLACRIWGRSAFYQSSGAYGFRDQLQDVMALVYAAPHLARAHLLEAAAHQFSPGDVLHWWHPPSGRGVRTRFSDDLLWLPYVTAHYVTTTGDWSVLDETIPFLAGPLLEPGQDERYGQYNPDTAEYSLYDHCLRALEKGATRGAHGLPLMGSGDWNDGMNRVGHEGRGESVWLAWFLIDTLQSFARLCEHWDELEMAAHLRKRAEEYGQAIEANAWDGDWYLRAFYDDGSPLGSSKNRECRIDAIAQSWAVLSNGGDPQRSRRAMQAVSEHLIKPEERLILLFTPPFDQTPRDPGYIKGYVPGVRENGGQYTHAAIWTVWAHAQLGQGDEAERLFRLLNPIYRSDSPEKAEIYKVEPYVISADVYGAPPHTGRGGWTWYTGSAGWLYRLGLEAILGLRRDEGAFSIDPCLPAAWPGYEITLRYGETVYQIEVQNPEGVNGGVAEVILDGEALNPGKIPWLEDGRRHQVIVKLGQPPQAEYPAG